MFLLLFRTTAIVIYMFGWIFITNFILSFVLIILMLAFDFWTVKNVSGRLLVGLRWWNEIREDSSNEWIFESREVFIINQNRVLNATDSRIFWTSLYAAPIIWIFLAVLAVFRLQASWFLVTLVAISMNSANLVGYTKCEKDAKKKLTQYISEQGFVQNLVGNAISQRLGAIF